MKKYFNIVFLFLVSSQLFSQSSWASFVMSNTACIGSTLNVSANTGTNVATGYTWTALPSNSIIAFPNNSITALTFIPAGTYTITLTADDGSTTATDTKTIAAGPNLTFTAPTASLCPPPTAIGGLYMTANGASTYTWNPGNIVSNPYSQPQPSISTVYTLSATDFNGCVGTSTILVPILPYLPIYVTGPSLVCDSSSNCYTVVAGPGFGTQTTYGWQGPCSTWGFGSSPCFTVSTACSGTYSFIVGDIDGINNCLYQTTFSITASVCTGLEESEIGNSTFEFFPNPALNTLNIKSNLNSKKNTKIEITDISGRIIFKSKCNFNAEGIYSIYVSEFSPGIYFARIDYEDQISKPIKIVIE